MKNRIRELRKANGLTMKQLGEVVDLAESTISQYETGKRQPDNETLLKISEYFGVTVGYLLGVEENKTPAESSRSISHNDILDEVDIAFYDGYRELSEDDKETVRDMVRVMRERRAKKQEK